MHIDSSIYSRIIGFEGHNLLQIMNKYHVDIRFSQSNSDNLDLVIYGRDDATRDDVFDCKEHLKMIQQVYVILFIFIYYNCFYNQILYC